MAETAREKPKRMQRRRTKGWKMPSGCIYVGRPTPFGNLFVLTDPYGGPKRAVLYFQECLTRAMNGHPMPASPTGGALSIAVIEHFHKMAKRINELRGKNLSCWCHLCDKHRDGLPLGEKCDDCDPCHADPLLEISNQ